jgi:hypothetical protein
VLWRRQAQTGDNVDSGGGSGPGGATVVRRTQSDLTSWTNLCKGGNSRYRVLSNRCHSLISLSK